MSSNAKDAFGGEYVDEAIICPECGETSPIEEWIDCEVGCEMCGDHEAIKCPRCEERFEMVWGYEKIEAANSNRKVVHAE